jgi:four helix bundle protein
MQDFRKLLVWQKAHQLALLTYRITVDFPREEVFGLRNSLRKISVDIPAYIAEGSGKADDREFGRSLSAALGFANRLEYYALVARDLTFLGEQPYDAYQENIVEVKKLINGFARRLSDT